MGPAQSIVVNKTHKKLCIITFNNADLLYHCKPPLPYALCPDPPLQHTMPCM